MERRKQKFRLGELTEDDFDQDYMPGRSEKTMSTKHKQGLERMADEIKARAAKISKSNEAITIVLEPE